MATAGTSSARSFYGCWTCRVRKKKCDENRPICSACVSLKLECYGYGDKPVWMDNGPLQREQASNVKRILSQNNSRQRKGRTFRTSSSQTDSHEENCSPSIAPYHYPSESDPSNGVDWSMEIVGDEVDIQTWNTNSTFFDVDSTAASSQGNLFTMEPSINHFQWENDMFIENNLSGRHDSMPSIVSGGSQDSEATLTRIPNTSTVQKDGGQTACRMSQNEMHLEAISVSAAGLSGMNQQTHAQALSTNDVVKEHPIFPTYPGQSVLGGEIDNLVMYYLDEVFYVQYPFYNSRHKQSRGWLFSLLIRAKSVYYATLALSERYLLSTTESTAHLTLSNKSDYHVLALQEMDLGSGEASWSGNASQDRTVEGITCILQLLSYELFAGGTGNWQHLLLTAAKLILPLIQARTKSIGPSLTAPDLGTQPQYKRHTYFADDIGTKVLLGSFISFDIIACASIRSLPSLGIDHIHILETFRIDLGSLFGCSNRVMAFIFEIVLLDNWKRDAEKSRQLSIVELVKRGTKIEERLRQEIRDLEDRHSLGSNLEHSGNTLSASQAEITNIFALSALTYLHVVVSGAYPELPEIAESVSKTITAFKGLTNPRLLRNLIWPFCVSGCLAMEGQQSFFRDLVSKAEIVPSTLGTGPQAYRIIEECWEMRKSCSYNCDWVFIMNKLGCNVLLL